MDKIIGDILLLKILSSFFATQIVLACAIALAEV